MLSFQTKNKKLNCLIDLKIKNTNINNFSSDVLTEKEHNHLKYGLKYCFIHHNENVKKYLSAELETLAQQTSDCVEPGKLEEYHNFYGRMLTYFQAIYTSQKITLITI